MRRSSSTAFAHAHREGARTVIFPMIENWHELSLELMSFDVAPQQDLYTRRAWRSRGVRWRRSRSSRTRSRSSRRGAVPHKSDGGGAGADPPVHGGHLRGIIGQLTVEEIVKQPEMVGDRNAR